MKKHYIQVGVTSLRSPNGDFLPSVPLYIEVSDSTDKIILTEEQHLKDVSGIFVEKYQKVLRSGKVPKY